MRLRGCPAAPLADVLEEHKCYRIIQSHPKGEREPENLVQQRHRDVRPAILEIVQVLPTGRFS